MPTEIPLSQGLLALVDDEDAARVLGFNWCASKNRATFYAKRAARKALGETKQVKLHRFILNAADDIKVDHRDGNGLNCQRSNLRACSTGQNNHNARLRRDNNSGFKGVSRDIGRTSWRACIRVNGKTKHIGCFKTRDEAAQAYRDAARHYFGDFARFE